MFMMGALQAASIIATAGRGKLIAHTLGPEGVGIVGVIDQIVLAVSYLSTFTLALSSLLYLSRSFAAGREAFRETYRAFLSVFSTLVIIGTVGALALIAAGHLGEDLLRYRSLLMIGVLAPRVMRRWLPTSPWQGPKPSVTATGRGRR